MQDSENLALLLGTINIVEIEGVVQSAAQSISTYMNIIEARIENLQRAGPNDNSYDAIDAQMIKIAIKEAIDRL
jgi:hypothetical protein